MGKLQDSKLVQHLQLARLVVKIRIEQMAQKLQLSAPLRITLIALCVVLAVGGALAVSPAARESVACSESTSAVFSPGGKYRAQMTEKICSWSMVQASSPFTLKIELQDKPGRHIDLPLEYSGSANSAMPGPTLKWKNASTLEITVYSNELSGTLVRHIDNLTITRRYMRAFRGAKSA